jgi:hypothetical protein
MSLYPPHVRRFFLSLVGEAALGYNMRDQH